MNIYFDKSNQYYKARVTRNGKTKYFYSTKGLLNEKQAKKELQAKYEEWLKNDGADKQSITIENAFNQYLKDKEKRVKRSSFGKVNDHYKKHLYPIRKTLLCECTRYTWQNILDKAARNGVHSPATIKNIFSVIKNFLAFCAAKGFILDNEVPKHYIVPLGLSKKKKQSLNKAALKFIFSDRVETERFIHLFRFAILTGLRRGELVALQRKRDYIEEQGIWVRESLSHQGHTDSPKSGKERYVPLDTLALKCIKDHEQSQKEKGYQFLFEHMRKQITARMLGNHWRNFRKKYSSEIPPITFHELRHTHITHSVKGSGIALEDLKPFFGHSDKMDTVGTYVHALELTEEEKEAKMLELKKLAKQLNLNFEKMLNE